MTLVIALYTTAVLAVLYWIPVRLWYRRWGVSDAELVQPMLGDNQVPHPGYQAMLAVTIDARPEFIWPWLVQLGKGRGGLYSYDWLDRIFGILDEPSANRILPEFQLLTVGDTIPLGPRNELMVAAIEPPHALVLSYNADGFEWVWQFGLYPLDNGRTRLVTRGTECFTNTVGTWLFMRVMEPAAFIMTRRMLLGLKQRAEALARTGETRASQRPAA